ncbi:uncharacterized protein T551_03641 [Pneumocystis jirovecii RU7]|uniref:Uncharacterized protein n=1 Tax=Pneumocystis jirovecii (strain RU7) TaxID=1408657 RepID=A0A0W4ZCM8_PNEJ7|nr:uncharacterized protein T551_03641 [Pneumocystis jirovecii RU7]KTW26069.1 hypothetical protein T551_03641 [Pneumocystis jirovecii RU7]
MFKRFTLFYKFILLTSDSIGINDIFIKRNKTSIFFDKECAILKKLVNTNTFIYNNKKKFLNEKSINDKLIILFKCLYKIIFKINIKLSNQR